jgi:hypothetical protein
LTVLLGGKLYTEEEALALATTLLQQRPWGKDAGKDRVLLQHICLGTYATQPTGLEVVLYRDATYLLVDHEHCYLQVKGERRLLDLTYDLDFVSSAVGCSVADTCAALQAARPLWVLPKP